MPKLTYTNELGESIVFSHRPPFILSNIEGLGDVGADIQTQKSPFQDGETHIGTVLEPRFIDMEISIVAKNIDECRRLLSSIMNPKINGVLRYEDNEFVREIKCVNEHVPQYSTRQKSYHLAMVNLICPSPYWKSLKITEEPAFEPLFEFPSDEYWELGEDGDLYFEMGLQRTDRIIENDSDAQIPVQIDFYGPADSPMIENTTTGEFIRINKRLEENEILKIDTTDGIKSVIYVDEYGNETNVFHWIDLSSTFFKLQIGENDITCNCAISNNAKDFDIYYQKQYVGV